MRLPYLTVDVFTDVPLAGNQLAVFPDAAALEGELMQKLAREMNYSESTFVVARSGVRAKVRIFTPETELPFAGHPSLGTAAVLASARSWERASDARVDAPWMPRVVLELGVGDVLVDVEPTAFGAQCELEAPPARRVALLDGPSLLGPMGLREGDLCESLQAEVWSCGNPFALLPLISKDAVSRSRCPPANLPGTIGVMPFAFVGEGEVHARVFCPGAGVPEDPATGSCNAPFAAYAHASGRLAEGARLTTHQGVEMGRPSKLVARMVKDGAGVLRPRVAGGVVFVAEGVLTI